MIELITQSPFGEIAALLLLAAVVGAAGSALRQPLIVSFIAVGLLAGPSVLGIAQSGDQIELLSQLGIALLLFLVGIKLDVTLIRSLGAVSLMTGMGQVLFTSVIGFALGLALGFTAVESLYIAVALTFSSTIIIVKLLSDKREIDSLHGQVALGFLIVQDLFVVIAMFALSAIALGAQAEGGAAPLQALLWGAVLLAIVIALVKYVADPLTRRLSAQPELLITFAIALAATFAAVGDQVGIGKEIGGLLAGVSLASTQYRDAIAARLAPLRDFLLLFFFIGLGASLDLSSLGAHAGAAFLFSVFVLVGNPAVVLAIMGAMGFRKRTGFLAGLTVAQISEFSLIFVAMGVSLGHLEAEILGLATLVGMITIAVSTYMITYSHQLYAIFEPVLGVFERGEFRRSEAAAAFREEVDIILIGMGRFGTAIGLRLHGLGVPLLAVDFNPERVRRASEQALEVQYGDATDPEFLAGLPLDRARWVVSTIPVHATGVTHADPRLALAQAIRDAGSNARLAVISHDEAEASRLLASGIDLVLQPFQDAADRAIELLVGPNEPAPGRTEAP